jgi:WNK lysine deficient protein kinase
MEEEAELVLETDPTGRFERFSFSLGKGTKSKQLINYSRYLQPFINPLLGAFKEVFKAFDQEEGVEVAWNQLRLDNFTQKDVQRILSEISILESLRNENIINLFYSWVIRSKDNVSIEKVSSLSF